jgi:hypothetical protein
MPAIVKPAPPKATIPPPPPKKVVVHHPTTIIHRPVTVINPRPVVIRPVVASVVPVPYYPIVSAPRYYPVSYPIPVSARFDLVFTPEAEAVLVRLGENTSSNAILAVHRVFGYLEVNPEHHYLKTRRLKQLSQIYGINTYESYAPAFKNVFVKPHRVLWQFGPEVNAITVLSITF